MWGIFVRMGVIYWEIRLRVLSLILRQVGSKAIKFFIVEAARSAVYKALRFCFGIGWWSYIDVYRAARYEIWFKAMTLICSTRAYMRWLAFLE